MAPKSVTLSMRKDRETKGTVVYQEVVEGDARGHQFYLLKDQAAAIGTPEQINLTVAAA